MSARKPPVVRKKVPIPPSNKLGSVAITFLAVFCLTIIFTIFQGSAMLSAIDFSLKDALGFFNEFIQILE
jgi:hypothetical protein